MMKFLNGDIFLDKSEAIVNTVNCIGVMGKGIALQFKMKYPENFKEYKKLCDEGQIKIGKMFLYETNDIIRKYIINFPTKTDYRKNSEYSYIKAGLKDLKNVINKYKIKSIAIPPLGCGNGGLNWNVVKQYIVEELSDLNCDISIYEPNNFFKDIASTTKADKKLTEARAINYLLFKRYMDINNLDTINNLEVQKLPYFLQESGYNLKLKYIKYFYGPYSENLIYSLDSMNNFLIMGFDKNIKTPEKGIIRINNKKYEDVIKFLGNFNYKEKLDRVFSLLSGFSGSYDLELLSSIHYLIKYENCSSLEEVKQKLYEWNRRKRIIFKNETDIKNVYNIIIEWTNDLN